MVINIVEHNMGISQRWDRPDIAEQIPGKNSAACTD
jgi:hypothetical protein